MSNNHPIQNGGGGGGMNVGFGSTEYYFGADPTSGESKAMVSLPTFEEGQRLVNEEHTTYDKHTILPQLPPTSSQLFQDKPQKPQPTGMIDTASCEKMQSRENELKN